MVSSGAVTRRYTDPYGNTRGAAATWSSAHSFLNAPVSTVSGLVQLGARAYDAAIGKFLSVDSILAPLNPAQNNGYDYAGNSPVTNSDPSGNCISDDHGGCLLRPNGSGSNSSAKSGLSAPSAPGIGSFVQKAWNSQLDIAGQFYSGIGEGLFGIGMFLWDASPIGSTVKAVESMGCYVSNYSSCLAQQQAAAAPWHADFWGTAEKTFIQPTLDDIANHPAHAIGELLPNLALFAIPGEGEARVAEEAGAAADAGAASISPGAASRLQ